MGLRIASESGVLGVLRNVRAAGVGEAGALGRLATGLRVNRASDGPADLVLSEQLRSQLGALAQAVENNQNARGLVETADAALGTVSDLLSRAQRIAVAAGDGTLDASQRRALQSALDQTLSAVDRIGATTRYGGRNLLDGGFELTTRNADPAIADLRLYGADLVDGFEKAVTVDVIAGATQAQAGGTIAPLQSGASTIRITGPLGTRDVALAAGATEDQVAQAVNDATSYTGVEAAGTPGARVLRSVDYGSSAFVRVEEVSGDLEGVAPGHTTGTDINAVVNGRVASGRGNALTVTDGVTGQITFAAGTGAGRYAFEIAGGGAQFQTGASAVPVDRITLGIPAVSSARLGRSSGVGALGTLATGGTNDLFTDPGNAIRSVSAAVDEVTSLRGSLGALSVKIFDAGGSALAVEIENLTGAESLLRDADFAQELAASERFALLRELGVRVLRNSNLQAGAALRLLA